MGLWDRTRIGLTFDDVVLVPAKSEILPSEVVMHTQITKNITIKINQVIEKIDNYGKNIMNNVINDLKKYINI